MTFANVASSGAASPEILGGTKCLILGQITLFFFEKLLSKHKMTIFFKNLGGHGPFASLATPMLTSTTTDFHSVIKFLCLKLSKKYLEERCN